MTINYKNKEADDYVELAPFMLELIDRLEKSEIPFELANRKTWKNFPHLYYPDKTQPKCIVNAPLHGGRFDTLYLTMNGLVEPFVAPSKSNDSVTSEKGLLPEVVYARILHDWIHEESKTIMNDLLQIKEMFIYDTTPPAPTFLGRLFNVEAELSKLKSKKMENDNTLEKAMTDPQN